MAKKKDELTHLDTPFKTIEETLDAFYGKTHEFYIRGSLINMRVHPLQFPVGHRIMFVGKKLKFEHRITRLYKVKNARVHEMATR